MRMEVHVGDDARIEQPQRIARGRIAESGHEFLGHRRAADDFAPFEHQHALAAARQIPRAHQPVMPAPDHDRVEIHSGDPAIRAPRTASAERGRLAPPRRRPGSSYDRPDAGPRPSPGKRSEEHTSELQSLMRISYAVFCLKKKKTTTKITTKTHT